MRVIKVEIERIFSLKLVLSIILLFAVFASLITAVNGYHLEEEETTTQQMGDTGLAYISMSLSTGISSAAAGYAVSETGKAAIGSITEKPELFGSTIIYVGLAEGIAIYGILTTFLIWIGL